jgi:hypothetical protein
MILAAAAQPADAVAARSQISSSLGWQFILACFGVGLPPLSYSWSCEVCTPGSRPAAS